MDETCGASAQRHPAAAASLHRRPRGPGLAASSWGSRAGRDTRPAGVGVAAAASLSSGCHRLASAPHPAPAAAAAAAAAATTAAGEQWGQGACAAYVEFGEEALPGAGGDKLEVRPAHARCGVAPGRCGAPRCPRSSRVDLPSEPRRRVGPTLIHTRAAVLRSQVGKVLLPSRTARLTVPPQSTCRVGVRRGGPGDLLETVIDSVLLLSICGLHFLSSVSYSYCFPEWPFFLCGTLPGVKKCLIGSAQGSDVSV